MKDGFIKAAAVTPPLRVADVPYNTDQTIALIQEAAAHGAKLTVFPELGLTGYTCGDLFLQAALLDQALEGLLRVARETAGADILSVVGLPLAFQDKLYNAAAFIQGGQVLGIATKGSLPNYNEFYEARHFSTLKENVLFPLDGRLVPLGPKLGFCARGMQDFRVAAEICEDMWVPVPPGMRHALSGATVIVNLSASNEIIGKADYRRTLLTSASARGVCAYIYADAGQGESTTDMVFGGHDLICEYGTILAEAKPFQEGILYGDIDLQRLAQERRRLTTFQPQPEPGWQWIPFDTKVEETRLERQFNPYPFVPDDQRELAERCEEILAIQAHGLRKRLEHIGLRTVTLGISGGLDSTLALLVTVRAFDSLGLPRAGIVTVTMPCFGTTDRTYQNAKKLALALKTSLREINIREAALQHLRDIGADPAERDVTYENAQARERTQVLMDVANKTGGIVVGTGDLSELALGFATYNGDHMSMYGVNASVPKTLVRHLVQYAAATAEPELAATLLDVLDTPVSPELLPPQADGRIAQQTEDIVGPYALHDFFLYYMVRWGFPKEKLRRLANLAFEGTYTADVIDRWLDRFYQRFFQNQFKRSCMPDGPKVGSVALSPRGDWRMPSDAVPFYRPDAPER